MDIRLVVVLKFDQDEEPILQIYFANDTCE